MKKIINKIGLMLILLVGVATTMRADDLITLDTIIKKLNLIIKPNTMGSKHKDTRVFIQESVNQLANTISDSAMKRKLQESVTAIFTYLDAENPTAQISNIDLIQAQSKLSDLQRDLAIRTKRAKNRWFWTKRASLAGLFVIGGLVGITMISKIKNITDTVRSIVENEALGVNLSTALSIIKDPNLTGNVSIVQGITQNENVYKGISQFSAILSNPLLEKSIKLISNIVEKFSKITIRVDITQKATNAIFSLFR